MSDNLTKFGNKNSRVNLTNSTVLVIVFKAYSLGKKKSISSITDICSVWGLIFQQSGRFSYSYKDTS